jgi:hypothetical protein
MRCSGLTSKGRTLVCEAEDRSRNELLDDEERQLLLNRIKRLKQGKA